MSNEFHALPIRIYYEDTDAGGVVYHANYLKFAERGRTEYLRDLGLSNAGIKADHGVIFVVRHTQADYLKPLRLDDLVKIESRVTEIRRSSFIMNQRIVHDSDIIFDMMVTLVCVDSRTIRPIRLPDEVRARFEGD